MENVRARRRAPGPSPWALPRLVRRLNKDRIGFFLDLWREYGDLVRIPFGGQIFFLLTRPEQLRHVFRENFRNYQKARSFTRERRALVGTSSLTAEGPDWMRRRRLVQPAFTRAEIDRIAGEIVRVAARGLERWESDARAGREIDLALNLTRLTIQLAGATLFGVELEGEEERLASAVGTIVCEASRRMAALVKIPLAVPTPANLRIRRALGTLDQIVSSVLSRRAPGAEGGRDLLGLLLAARDEESGTRLSNEDLAAEMRTFLIAGHESTAASLAWTHYLLASHPLVYERLADEVREVLGGRPPGVEDLPRLSLARRIAEESLRLYPPSWLFDREAIEEDEIGGYEIPAGSILLICPYLMHRHPDYWENPDSFDPDRFLPERSASRPDHLYIPFSAGPRSCVGGPFAVQESQILVAMIAQRYRVRLAEGQRLELATQIALRPRHGVRATLSSLGS